MLILGGPCCALCKGAAGGRMEGALLLLHADLRGRAGDASVTFAFEKPADASPASTAMSMHSMLRTSATPSSVGYCDFSSELWSSAVEMTSCHQRCAGARETVKLLRSTSSLFVRRVQTLPGALTDRHEVIAKCL